MSVYSSVLAVHSWLRWFTFLMCVGALISAARSVFTRDAELPGKRWDVYLMLAVDLQMLTGFILYFGLSPFTMDAMNNPSLAVEVPALRFWSLLHPGMMFTALVLVRVGRILALNAPTLAVAQRRRLLCFAVSTALMVAAIPWPGLANGRPLVRF